MLFLSFFFFFLNCERVCRMVDWSRNLMCSVHRSVCFFVFFVSE